MQYDKLGIYIKQKRLENKFFLNDFARNNDIEPAVLSRIENLKQSIKLNTLQKIAKGFNKTPSEFLAEFENS